MMFAESGPGWTLAQSAVSAAAGLIGVFVGSWLTARNQKRERLNAHYRLQLQEFYSPLLGMKDEIKAKDESQKVIQELANKIHRENASRLGKTQDLVSVYRYSSTQWVEEIFPLFRKMSTYFSDHMWLAEQSTRDHYQKLVHVIEVWKRQQASTLSADLSWELTFSDDELKPLYDDLENNFKLLRKRIKQT